MNLIEIKLIQFFNDSKHKLIGNNAKTKGTRYSLFSLSVLSRDFPLQQRHSLYHDGGDDRRTALPTSFSGTVRVLSSLFSHLSPFSGTVRGGLTSLSLFRRGHHCLCVFRRSTLRDFLFLRSISLHFICYVL